MLFTAALFFTTIVFAATPIIPIGQTPNVFDCLKSRCNLWYDQDINTIVFIHRGNPAVVGGLTNGSLYYDISIDGGQHWLSNQGPVYSDPGGWGAGGSFCGIYNPLSNTIPSNAYIAYDAQYSNSGGRAGRLYGEGKLDLSGASHHYDSLSHYGISENLFIVKNTRDLWSVGKNSDTLSVAHGIWNNGTNEYDFSFNFLPPPANHNAYAIDVVDMDIAFNDAGTTGYIAQIIYNESAIDSTLYLDIYTTHDGGATWEGPLHLDTHTIVDTLLVRDPSVKYGPMFDLDIVVDANSKLHILTGIARSSEFSVFTNPGLWGMFDVNNVSGCWQADLLDKPMTFRGVFGDGSADNPTLNEDSRPFASRSWDGTKLFFSWFDTDTIIFGSIQGNLFPDLHSIGYDVTTQLWTTAMNLTTATSADGSCTFGNGSYYVISQGQNVFSIPTVIQALGDPVQTGSPSLLYYLPEANVDMSTATIAHVIGINQTGCIDTLRLLSDSVISVWPIRDSAGEITIYPNPTYDRLNIRSAKEEINRVEIVDANGRKMYSRQINAANVEIPVAEFSTGIYTVRVITNKKVIHKKTQIVK